MSNQVIGNVYSTIIEKIIADSKDDFEAAGLDQDTLQDLKQLWQKKISDLEIAHCPWDPPPVQQQISNPPTVPSNVKLDQHYKTEQQFKNDHSGSNTPSSQNGQPAMRNGGDAPVKQEIKYENNVQGYSPHPNYQGALNPQFAQQRANQLLAQQYGSQANASIQASQARQMQNPVQQRPTHIQLPAQPRPGQPQYPQQQSSLGAAQTDGSADDAMAQWKATLAERRVHDGEIRREVDHMLREHIAESAFFQESGLMVPLSEHSRKDKKRRNVPSSAFAMQAMRNSLTPPSSIAQLDGVDNEDDKEDVKKQLTADEDAINSDLDDSDDDLENEADDENEGPMGETILCTYDKVQRVKNKHTNGKWKCTLKDGILTTGKKEYVFHKAQGEFEW